MRLRRSSQVVVEPDAGGEREESCCDAGAEVQEGAGAAAFEGESVFARQEDAFDALADRGEVQAALGFVLACGTQEPGAHRADRAVEVFPA